MSLQTIINSASSLTINRRKVVSVQYSRNEIPRTSQTPTRNPWKFMLEMPNSVRYSQGRSLIEELDRLDKTTPEVITFSNNPKLSWMFAYQGAASVAQLGATSVTSFIGDQLVLGNLPAIPSGAVLFAPNDLIQLGTNPYPFTVTSTVLRGSGSSVTITMSRPNIITASVAGAVIRVGNACQFNMFCPNMPTYKLLPGGAIISRGVVLNNAVLEFSGPFELQEYVGGA